jgi:Tol biopolymer transport system component
MSSSTHGRQLNPLANFAQGAILAGNTADMNATSFSALLAFALFFTIPAPAQTAVAPAGSAAFQPVFSPDGRHLAFLSAAPALATNDTNGRILDIFLLELTTGQVTLVSATPDGAGSGSGPSYAPQFAGGGEWLVFESQATNLVAAADANGAEDVFARHLATGQTRLLSAEPGGGAGSGASWDAHVAAAGRRVIFTTRATNLFAIPDGNAATDVAVADVEAGAVHPLSTNRLGRTATGVSSGGRLSADGRRAVFLSRATDIVFPGPAQGDRTELYFHDFETPLVQMLRVRTNGAPGSVLAVHLPAISPDGNWAAAAIAGQGTIGALWTFNLTHGAASAPPRSGSGTNLYQGFEATDGPAFTAAGLAVYAGQTAGGGGVVPASLPRTVRVWPPGTTNDPVELAAPGLPTAAGVTTHSPAFSGDGSRIAVQHTTLGLLVFDSAGQLVGGPYDADDWSAPALNHDGTRLAFHKLVPGATPGEPATTALFIVDVVPRPGLALERTAGGLKITWPAGNGFALEQAAGAGAAWQLVAGGEAGSAEVAVDGAVAIFRLRRP